MARNKRRYTIGEVSQICNLSKKTLRFYDEKGLLTPSERDEENNYRYYSEQEILQALIIRDMKTIGFTLQEMKKNTQIHDLTVLKYNLDKKIIDIEKEIKFMKSRIQFIQSTQKLVGDAISILNQIEEIEDTNIKDETQNTLDLRMIPEMTVIFTRYCSKVNAEELFWDRFAEVKNLRDSEKAIQGGPFTAIFHNHYLNQFYNEDGDLEIILPIINGDLNKPFVKKFGSFLVASKIFVGRYTDLLAVYKGLAKLIEQNNYEIIGSPIEEYLVEFSHGVTEDNCITRVSFPVKVRTATI